MPKKLALSDNRLTDKGGHSIVAAFDDNLEELDFSMNPKVGGTTYESISEFLQAPGQHLKKLNMEKNQMGDYYVGLLSQSLIDNYSLEELNIGNNQLSDKGTKHLARMLQLNTHLRVLSVRWNKIRS